MLDKTRDAARHSVARGELLVDDVVCSALGELCE
jgi:hypothetical protein